ncbi:MAG: type IX secretion system membrane protein PorP/SprF [Marinoscillum sp.]
MKRYCFLVIAFLGIFSLKAQNGPYFGHYMFNPSYLNPGWGGGERDAFVAFQHRTQWLGYSTSFDGPGGAPSTQMLTAIVPIRGFFISSIGINVINDNLGPVSNLHAMVPLTYSLDLNNSVLSFGVAAGLFSQTLKFDELRFNDSRDPLNVGSRQTQTAPNLNAGVFFRNNQGLFLGAGVQNILEPGFTFGMDSLDNIQTMNFALHGGVSLKVSDNLTLSPTVLVRSDLSAVTFDVGGIVTWSNKMWSGLSYRRGESMILYLGYSLMENNRLKVGYSFDYVFQDQTAKAATSHEIFVRYDLPDLVFGGRKKVKTPRFSF